MTAIAVVLMFLLCICSERPEFECQVTLRQLMKQICDLLTAGDASVREADALDDILLAFHTMFMHLYPGCAVPKLHLCRHIPEAFRIHKINRCCIPGERLHHRTKEFGRFAFRSFQLTILRRTIRSTLNDFAKPDCFSPVRLDGKPLRRKLNVLGVMMICWKSVTVGLTYIAKGFVVHWDCGGMMVGLVRGIVDIDGKMCVSAHRLDRLGPDAFSVDVSEEIIVDCVAVSYTHLTLPTKA